MRTLGGGSARWWRVVVIGAQLVACASVVGIEELNPGPDPNESSGGSDGAGRGGSSGRGGTSGASMGGTQDGGSSPGGRSPFGGTGAGGSDSAGAAGSTPLGGAENVAGASGGPGDGVGGSEVDGGESGMGGAPSGGVGGAGGAPNPDDPTVTGKVIDAVGQPVAAAPVTIGNTTVMTNALGEFTIENVPDEYDVSLVLTIPGLQSGVYAWVYQGLSRRDPTLQVYRGRPLMEDTVNIEITNGVFEDGVSTSLGFGSVDGAEYRDISSATSQRTLYWYGSSLTAGTLHLLRWATGAEDLPTAYQSYVTQTIALDSGGSTAAMVNADMAPTTIEPGAISGTVTSPTTANRQNHVFVRFTTHAAIRLLTHYSTSETFSYVVPNLPNSVITVAASEGRIPGQFAIAHRDVAPDQANIALEVPTAPLQTAPGEEATNIGAGSTFRWTSDAAVSLLHIEDTAYYRGMYVLTARKEVTLPELDGFSLRANGEHFWQIQVHGNVTSMDDATKPGGFQDAFGGRWDDPLGPKRGDGTFAMSYRRFFTTPE